MSGHARIDRRLAAAALGISSAFAATATAQDVAIEDVLVTQAIRFFATPLVGENVTFVRVFVETPGTSAPVPAWTGWCGSSWTASRPTTRLSGRSTDRSPARRIPRTWCSITT